ncbi:Ankyrin_repeat protein 1 [Hexamita inflata]|uniref:Ankyrin repeat protein 1 n=1 Tax=Hexamita inflata TaxID=28002 RepID=A0AA86R016_9EUKA|nr:Ankyrin repeat protein 1 [Hexamita inflata]
MCFAACGSRQPPEWFEACSTGNIEQITDLMDDCTQHRDHRPFQIYSKNEQQFMVHTGFTGLMYAIVNNQQEVVELLLNEEYDILCNQDTVVQTSEQWFTHQITVDMQIIQSLKKNNIQFYSQVPAGSTILDLALLLGNLELYIQLAQKLPRRIINHINESGYNNLFYLIELSKFFYLEPVNELTRPLFKFLFQRQSLFYSIHSPTSIKRCLIHGSYAMLDILFSLFSKKYKVAFTSFIDNCNLQDYQDTKEQLKCVQLIAKFKQNEYDEEQSEQNSENNKEPAIVNETVPEEPTQSTKASNKIPTKTSFVKPPNKTEKDENEQEKFCTAHEQLNFKHFTYSLPKASALLKKVETVKVEDIKEDLDLQVANLSKEAVKEVQKEDEKIEVDEMVDDLGLIEDIDELKAEIALEEVKQEVKEPVTEIENKEEVDAEGEEEEGIDAETV